MKITIIGTGYVGLVTGACLAEKGHSVTCLDIDQNKISTIKQGKTPIYEQGLEELIQKNINKNLHATTDPDQAMKNTEAIFIAVGTPSKQDGSLDTQYIESAAKAIAKHLKNYAVIIIKSTVLPGTTELVNGDVGRRFDGAPNCEVQKIRDGQVAVDVPVDRQRKPTAGTLGSLLQEEVSLEIPGYASDQARVLGIACRV